MKSFIGWIGGKNLLKREIINHFPDDKYDYYIEVFGGAAWVLFEKAQNGETEIYNDLNGDLINLFRCIKYHCTELQRELQFVLNSRELFENFKSMNKNGMTDIQRAARFFMLIKTSYGAKDKGSVFGCVKKDVASMITYLKQIEIRLRNVVIENKDFTELINTFKNKNALFYLDPPYYGTEKYYSVEFIKSDHDRLYECLSNISAKFILTYNDCDYIKNLYDGFNITNITRSNNLSTSKNGHQYREIIITNY